jgi:dTDP-4-amino-4,6-dideoxy-D-galactose acyltransferase
VTSNVIALAWDSEFFSKSIATITNINKVTIAELANFDLITNKVASDNYLKLTQFNQLGFCLAEGELTFIKELTENSVSELSIELATEVDISELVSLAKKSYVSTRFRQPWFTSEQSNNFYGTWIKKAVLGEFDDVCLIIKTADGIQGFISLKKVKKQIKIGLIAVSQAAQGKGIARKLLVMADVYALQQQCSQITVATQTSNIAAINLYSRNNYSLKESNYWLYKSHC